ncbi:hypothetical protein Syn7803C108_9 [Synechococcus phage ACG-2014d]|uniref:D-alanyl-D-alanine carboxypeptidase-like core domain-containing protein n=1 Tax=Synechococcus phage ACG-2014d TaxID=1493509 RepID=A0A0E3HWQ4_9CAUD|nr:hypothetical protein Syn7803C108_9 [Synechococcus phage ACG-2014d]
MLASKIKPHKLIPTTVSSEESGGIKVASSVKQSVYSVVTSANQIGKTLEGMGYVMMDISETISNRSSFLGDQLAEQERLSDLRRDARAEIEAEGGISSESKDGLEDGLEDEIKKKKNPLGWLEKILGPFGNLFAWLARTAISRGILEWFSDEKNLKKMEDIFNTLKMVGDFVYKLVTFSVGAIFDGLAKIFGGAKAIANGNLGGAWDMIVGVGTLLTGIIGLKALSYLLNPFSLIQDAMTLFDALQSSDDIPDPNNPKPKTTPTPNTNNVRSKAEILENIKKRHGFKNLEQAEEYARLRKVAKQSGEELTEAGIEALVKQARKNKPAGLLGRLGNTLEDVSVSAAEGIKSSLMQFADFLGDHAKNLKGVLIDKPAAVIAEQIKDARKKYGLSGSAAEIYARFSDKAKKAWETSLDIGKKYGDRARTLGANLKSKAGDAVAWADNGLKGAGNWVKNFATAKIVEPLGKFFEPMMKPIKAMAGQVMGKVMSSGAGIMMEEYLQKKGLSLLEPKPLIQRIGGKALPIVGGLINLLFAYDRLTDGDVVGAGIEALSAAFDLSGAFGFAAGPYVSLGLDVFSLFRDLIPGIRQMEDAMIGSIPGAKGLIDQVNTFAKDNLPAGPLKALIGMFTNEEGQKPEGIDKDEDKAPELAKGGGLKSTSTNTGALSRWQTENEQPIQPKDLAPVSNPAKSNYRAAGWTGFALGGELPAFAGGGPIGKYKNGEVPASEMQGVKGYAGWGQAGKGKLHKSVAKQFQSMLDAAKKAGHPIGINDTFRTFADQQHMYNTKPRGTAAVPGTSNHGFGLAADLNYFDAGYKWLWDNSETFGFKTLSKSAWGLRRDRPGATEAWHFENLSGSGSSNANVKTSPVTADDSTDTSTDTSVNTTPGGNTSNSTTTQDSDNQASKAPAETQEQKMARIFGMLDSAINDVRGQLYGNEKSSLAPASASPPPQMSSTSAPGATPAVATISKTNALNKADSEVDKKGKTVVPITLPITNTKIINTGGEPIVLYRDPNSSYPTK